MNKRKRKKSKKSKINWTELIISGLIDLFVSVVAGIILKRLE